MEKEEGYYDIKQSGFTDKWGTYKYLTDIQSDIKKDITSDFILAKLNENQKESVIELVRDAYFIKKEMAKLIDYKNYDVDEKGKYKKNKDGTYKMIPLDKDEKKYLLNLAKETFNTIMIKIIMTKIEYRNVEKNVIVELITEKNKMNAENEYLEEENRTLKERMKKNIKKGKEEKE